MSAEETLLEFPCEFPIKVFGEAADDFRTLVAELVESELGGDGYSIRETHSRKGRYISVTVTITATSKSQIDQIYRSLSGHERIMMVL